MERLHLPDNMKVHFAGLESYQDFRCVEVMGVQYGLYSAYNAVYSRLFGKKKSEDSIIPSEYMCGSMRHVIQDSGLFSMLYGSSQHLANEHNVYRWYDSLVEYTLGLDEKVTCIECDCQNFLGIDKCWDLRYRMREDLKDNRIIYVFHRNDGLKELDRLCEFADYIGIPNMDFHDYMYQICVYIKSKNPEIDIHLLGCTHPELLKRCSFASSCDSTTWFRSRRYGDLLGYHISDLDTQKVIDFFGKDIWNAMSGNTENETVRNAMCVSIEHYKRLYQKNVGNQDYSVKIKQ